MYYIFFKLSTGGKNIVGCSLDETGFDKIICKSFEQKQTKKRRLS
jgi:hypothetical protein